MNRRRFHALGLLAAASLPLGRPVSAKLGPTPEIKTFEDALRWLEVAAPVLVRSSKRTMKDGTAAFPPQAGPGYEAFWLRDYSYVLEGCADALSAKELGDACQLFISALDPSGAGVDCIKFDGTSIYQPGYGTMGEKPVADGSIFTIEMAWQTYLRLPDKPLAAALIDKLLAAHAGIPRNPDTGLVHISEQGHERCPYGFTDSVRKQGDELFCSLLLVEASKHLAVMLGHLGRGSEAAEFNGLADDLNRSIRQTFWDEKSGLFLAATGKCRQPDLWGSAFAVYTGSATPEQSLRIATWFKENHYGVVQKGQLRHLPAGMYWDQACTPDTYQNGGYWATPTGWLICALDLVDPALADQTLIDLVKDFQLRGVNEWVLGDSVHVANYLSSATLPLAGARKLQARRAEQRN